MIIILVSGVVGFIVAITSSQYVIPFCVKKILPSNHFLKVDLLIAPAPSIDKNLVEYYFRVENKDVNISINDINIDMNFQSVIQKETLHHKIGVLGVQSSSEIKDDTKTNCVNITIEKIFPKGVLLITYLVRNEKFGEPPFSISNLCANSCNIAYSYMYLGTTIRQKNEISIPKIDFDLQDNSSF